MPKALRCVAESLFAGPKRCRSRSLSCEQRTYVYCREKKPSEQRTTENVQNGLEATEPIRQHVPPSRLLVPPKRLVKTNKIKEKELTIGTNILKTNSSNQNVNNKLKTRRILIARKASSIRQTTITACPSRNHSARQACGLDVQHKILCPVYLVS